MAGLKFDAMADIGNPQAYAIQPKQQSAPQQPQNKGNFLTSLIPSAGGIAGGLGGAAIGTAIAPGIGTILGGLLGGAIGGGGGKVAENAVEHQDNLGSGVAGEALINGILSAGPLRLLKLGGETVQGLRGGAGLADAIANAGTKATESSLAKTAVQTINNTADRQVQEGFGLKVGQNVGGGQVLTPDRAGQIQDFITNGAQKYGGIKPGTPISQARQAQSVLNNVTQTLNDTLTKIDRPLQPQESAGIVKNALSTVTDNPAVTGSTNTLGKFTTKLENAKSLQDLEAVRRQADDLAYTATGAGKTSAAAQAHAVRDAIDQFITPLSPEYKAVKNDYQLAKDALNFASKANVGARGLTLPLVGQVGKQVISGTRSKVGSIVAGATDKAANSAVNAYSIPKIAGRILPVGVAGDLAGQIQSPNSTLTPNATTSTNAMSPSTDIPSSYTANASNASPSDLTSALLAASGQQSSPYSQANLMSDIQRDPKNADKYLGLFSGLQKATAAPSGSKLNATQLQQSNNAQSGLGALQTIQQELSKDPTVLLKANVPTNIAQNALGAGVFNTARKEASDVIARLRTGAAINDQEAKFYMNQLPQFGDNPDTINYKLNLLGTLFSRFASPQQPGAADASGSDLIQALLAAQGGQ